MARRSFGRRVWCAYRLLEDGHSPEAAATWFTEATGKPASALDVIAMHAQVLAWLA